MFNPGYEVEVVDPYFAPPVEIIDPYFPPTVEVIDVIPPQPTFINGAQPIIVEEVPMQGDDCVCCTIL